MNKETTIQSISRKASDLLKSRDNLKLLLQGGKEKLLEIEKKSAESSALVRKIETVIRMIRAHISGDYKSFSIPTLSLLVFGLVYFITPTDLIPDLIPALGFTDDLSILVWIFKSLKEDIENFEEWEISEN